MEMDHDLNLELINRLLTKDRDEGFSLIEMVVIVAVLATISAIAIPSFTCFPKKAKATAALGAMKDIQQECQFQNHLEEIEIFTAIPLDGYKIQPEGSNNCQGSGGRVSAVPSDTSIYPTFHLDYKTGELSYSFKGKTGSDVTACLSLICQKGNYSSAAITDWKAYASETASKYKEFSPKVKGTSCETPWSGNTRTGKAQYATDGNPNTKWTCNGMGTIDFDLKKKQEIRSINIQFSGDVTNANYVKLYIDEKLVAEGTQPCCGDGYTWLIESIKGQTIRYETIKKPHILNLDGVEDGENPQFQTATWSEIGELSINGKNSYRTNKGHYESGTGIFCDMSWSKAPCQ